MDEIRGGLGLTLELESFLLGGGDGRGGEGREGLVDGFRRRIEWPREGRAKDNQDANEAAFMTQGATFWCVRPQHRSPLVYCSASLTP